MDFDIDRQTGAVRFPTGERIEPEMTQEAFRATDAARRSTTGDYGTAPWIHYYFQAGPIAERELRASLCFFDQLLVFMTLQADLDAQGSTSWDNYSLDAERATAEFHRRRLTEMLGPPTEVVTTSESGPIELGRRHDWIFPWGQVRSGHSSRDGNTSIGVWYGDRHAEATRRYEAHQHGPST